MIFLREKYSKTNQPNNSRQNNEEDSNIVEAEKHTGNLLSRQKKAGS